MSYSDEETIGKFDRIHYLIEYLASSNHGLTVEDMANKYGVSLKTIRRDMESIKAIFGLDLLKERGPDRKLRYRVERRAVPFRPLVLDIDEIISIHFIRGFAHFNDVSFIHNNINQLFKKIKLEAVEAKKRSGNNFFERVCNLFVLPKELGGKVYDQDITLDLLYKLIEAAIDFKICEVTYGIGENNKSYIIAPLHFFNYRDAIYLLTKNIELSNKSSKNIFTNLAFHRVKSVNILNDHFDYPADLNLKKYFKSDSFNFADEMHSIVLKFPPKLKDYILERDWYPNQKMEVQKDGSVRMTFESDLNMMMIGWIRGFGPDVKVIGPKELMDNMIKDLKNNLTQY